jgi:hypothetical protein
MTLNKENRLAPAFWDGSTLMGLDLILVLLKQE